MVAIITQLTAAVLALAFGYPRTAPRPRANSALLSLDASYTFADGLPKGKALSPFVVRLRTSALRKPSPVKNLTDAQRSRWSVRRVVRVVRAAQQSHLPPSQASDLIDSIPTRWSWRKRRVAVALTHAFAEEGVIVRSGTYASLIGACRRDGDLDGALALISRLEAVGKRPNPNVYSSLMSELCAHGEPEKARRLLGQMREAGVSVSNVTLTILLSSLLKAHAIEPALALTEELRQAHEEAPAEVKYDLPMYNVMLQALLAGGDDDGVRELLETLRSNNLLPSPRTLNILLRGFATSSLEAVPSQGRPNPASSLC